MDDNKTSERERGLVNFEGNFLFRNKPLSAQQLTALIQRKLMVLFLQCNGSFIRTVDSLFFFSVP